MKPLQDSPELRNKIREQRRVYDQMSVGERQRRLVGATLDWVRKIDPEAEDAVAESRVRMILSCCTEEPCGSATPVRLLPGAVDRAAA